MFFRYKNVDDDFFILLLTLVFQLLDSKYASKFLSRGYSRSKLLNLIPQQCTVLILHFYTDIFTSSTKLIIF